MWPNDQSAHVGRDDWDWTVTPYGDHMVFSFKDRGKALLFKLSCGGA